MAERFVYSTGTIDVATGASVVTGTGTAWGGRDRAASQIWAVPADAAAFLVGIVAEVDPRGIYDDLELPLVAPYNGAALEDVAYVLIDGPAIASGTAVAANLARFNAQLEQNAGLAYSDADAIDYALVPNNSLVVHDATKRLKQWRNGVFEDVANGIDGAAHLWQAAEPDTDYPEGSTWVKSDSAQLKVYQLIGDPLAWTDTGAVLKGIDGASALTVVRIVATTNIDLATGLVNGATYDAITLATGELALLVGQTDPAENGVYPVVASGAASRAAAFATYNDHPGRYFSVMEGAAKHDTFWRCTSDKGGTLGTTALVFSEVTGDVAASTHAAAGKTVPADADEIPLVDSAASNVLKKLTWSNLKAALASTFLSSGFMRERLTANRIYYVRADGVDTNDGLSNTSGGAFLTIQKAVNVIFGSLDLGGFDVTIQLGAGATFTGNISVNSSQVGAGKITINGDVNPANTGNYVITGASGSTLVVDGFGSKIAIQGVELRGATHVLQAQNGGYIQITGYVRFGAAGASHMRSLNGFINAQGISYAIVGGATHHYLADQTGCINTFATAISVLAGTFNFSTAFAVANRGGVFTGGSSTFTLMGTVTGVRHLATNGGGLDTAGGGVNFFPGNAAGTVTSPAWFI